MPPVGKPPGPGTPICTTSNALFPCSPKALPQFPELMDTPNTKGPLLPERLAARLWRNRQGVQLRTLEGKTLRVLYPGRPNGGPGPDFKDALLQTEEGQPARGDVEVHREAKGWKAHGHQRDPGYNNVTLHLVYGEEPTAPAQREDGGTAPSALMPLEPPQGAGEASWLAQQMGPWRAMQPQERLQALSGLGEKRFLLKSAAYRLLLERVGPDQALYCGLMEALGYSRNRLPFLELAQRLPWESVRATALAATQGARAAVLGALLLAAAGLDAAEHPGKGNVLPMPSSRWTLAGLRPQNHPKRRLAGAAALFARVAEEGLVGYCLGHIHQGNAATLGKALEAFKDGQTLIGRDRALDMAVNVGLPCLRAWASLRGDTVTAGASLKAYQGCPKLADNELLREAAYLLGLPPAQLARNACQQQGAIHLYKTLLKTGDAHIYGASWEGASTSEAALREVCWPYQSMEKAA